MNRAPLIESFLFRGEDRGFGGNSLFVDLVPSSSWAQNARAVLSPSEWKRVSLIVKHRCRATCEACGASEDAPRKCFIEAHERWHYDMAHANQTLRRLVGLCSRCHRATHFGFAASKGMAQPALRQLEKVNKWSKDQALDHVKNAFDVWNARSAVEWSIDMSILDEFKGSQKIKKCISVCHIHEGKCLGCTRKPAEIFLPPGAL